MLKLIPLLKYVSNINSNLQIILQGGKEITYSVDWNGYKEYLKKFFDNGNGVRNDLIKYFIPSLKEILEWERTQLKFRLYGSNITTLLKLTC